MMAGQRGSTSDKYPGWLYIVLGGACKKKRFNDYTTFKPFLVQLNEYETAPYSIQFSQNLTFCCVLISVFSPKYT